MSEITVIVGIGNERRRDDGVGIAVARLLAAGELPPTVRVEEAAARSFDLPVALEGAARAIILAAVALGDEPGAVHVLSPADAEARADYLSPVGTMALMDALGLGGLIDVRPEALVVGVEPAEIAPGHTLTREVRPAVATAAQVALEVATSDAAWRRALREA